ncbi:MAG: hypothetical protein WAT78_04985 [Rhizobiaceae bacterium]
MFRLALCLIALIVLPAQAGAVPKSSGGQTCTSSGTKACTGKENGVKVNCSSCDFCTFNVCEPVGGEIKCFTKTEFSNPTGCTPARVSPKNTIKPGVLAPKARKLQ